MTKTLSLVKLVLDGGLAPSFDGEQAGRGSRKFDSTVRFGRVPR